MCHHMMAQNISITSMEELPLDLTARTSPVIDGNGIPCALVKIASNDEVIGIDGNVVRFIDKGSEYWVYLTSGTKKIIVKPRHHSPIEVQLDAKFVHGLDSSATYRLELTSDLPSEVLYGTSDPFEPVAMAKHGEPLLPKWWNTQQEGMYVGISSPTYDAKAAKQMALLNALSSYAQDSDGEVKYRGTSDVAKDNIDNFSRNYQSYILDTTGFEVEISQEHYNSNGEYFILCRITPNEITSNKFRVVGEYFDDNDYSNHAHKTTLSAYTASDIRINRRPFIATSSYAIKIANDTTDITCQINDKEIFNENILTSKRHDDLTNMKLHGGLGICQTRLLSALVCIPHLISGRGRTVTDDTGDDVSDSHYYAAYELLGSGANIPRRIRLLDYSDGVKFMVEEKFPNLQKTDIIKHLTFNDHYGLSANYQRHMDQNMDSTYFSLTSGNTGNEIGDVALEYKNSALLTACIDAILKEASSLRGKTQISDVDSNTSDFDKFYNTFERLNSATININPNPLWLLDPSQRVPCKNKKDMKEWQEYQKEWENEVWIITPGSEEQKRLRIEKFEKSIK